MPCRLWQNSSRSELIEKETGVFCLALHVRDNSDGLLLILVYLLYGTTLVRLYIMLSQPLFALSSHYKEHVDRILGLGEWSQLGWMVEGHLSTFIAVAI